METFETILFSSIIVVLLALTINLVATLTF